jgi:DNA-binding response OmpR family regulator
MSLNRQWASSSHNITSSVSPGEGKHIVLIVEDHQDARPELKQLLTQKGYRVIDTDNGQDAAQHARQIRPDLLVVDMDVPLLYELVAARQIMKLALAGALPVVKVTHEESVDAAPLMELGTSRNEYVTRLSDYAELQPLLDYLLPVMARVDDFRLRMEANPPIPLPAIMFD